MAAIAYSFGDRAPLWSDHFFNRQLLFDRSLRGGNSEMKEEILNIVSNREEEATAHDLREMLLMDVGGGEKLEECLVEMLDSPMYLEWLNNIEQVYFTTTPSDHVEVDFAFR